MMTNWFFYLINTKMFTNFTIGVLGHSHKYFGIDKVEESISHRQEKFVKRYSGYSNSLCHSISARLWHVKLLILYYCLCVFLLNLRYFLCYHVMVNKVVYNALYINVRYLLTIYLLAVINWYLKVPVSNTVYSLTSIVLTVMSTLTHFSLGYQ